MSIEHSPNVGNNGRNPPISSHHKQNMLLEDMGMLEGAGTADLMRCDLPPIVIPLVKSLPQLV